MKIIVFSDSHGAKQDMLRVLEKMGADIDVMFHLGDYIEDIILLHETFPNLPIFAVRGNNDFYAKGDDAKKLQFENTTFLLTHGHLQNVSWNFEKLAYWGAENEANVILFGHTHVPTNLQYGNLRIFNPGSISQPRNNTKKSFGLITIAEEKKKFEIIELEAFFSQ